MIIKVILTLEPKTKQFPERHPLERVVVDLEDAAGDTHQLFPVTGPHGGVAQVIYQGQAGLEGREGVTCDFYFY